MSASSSVQAPPEGGKLGNWESRTRSDPGTSRDSLAAGRCHHSRTRRFINAHLGLLGAVHRGVSVTGHLHPRNTQPGSEHAGVVCARGPREVSCARCGFWGMSAGGITPLGRSRKEMLQQMGVDEEEHPDFGSSFLRKKNLSISVLTSLAV